MTQEETENLNYPVSLKGPEVLMKKKPFPPKKTPEPDLPGLSGKFWKAVTEEIPASLRRLY